MHDDPEPDIGTLRLVTIGVGSLRDSCASAGRLSPTCARPAEGMSSPKVIFMSRPLSFNVTAPGTSASAEIPRLPGEEPIAIRDDLCDSFVVAQGDDTKRVHVMIKLDDYRLPNVDCYEELIADLDLAERATCLIDMSFFIELVSLSKGKGDHFHGLIIKRLLHRTPYVQDAFTIEGVERFYRFPSDVDPNAILSAALSEFKIFNKAP